MRLTCANGRSLGADRVGDRGERPAGGRRPGRCGPGQSLGRPGVEQRREQQPVPQVHAGIENRLRFSCREDRRPSLRRLVTVDTLTGAGHVTSPNLSHSPSTPLPKSLSMANSVRVLRVVEPLAVGRHLFQQPDRLSGAVRPAGHVWLVRLRPGPQQAIVAVGLGKPSADYLAAQVRDVIDPPPLATPARIR